MLVSAIVLAFGGESLLPLNVGLPVDSAAEQVPIRDPHPLFPLLETPINGGESDRETRSNLESRTGTSESGIEQQNAPIFVPLGTSDHPQNDTPQDPLFVPVSPNPTED